jgi:polar amino acid transport system permease protein
MRGSILEQLPHFFSYYNSLFLLQAFGATLSLSLVGCIVGFILGFGLAFVRNPRLIDLWPARVGAITFTETFRRIPFLVKLMVIFFAYEISGLKAPMFVVAATTVALAAAAYSAEIVRAGLESLHPNQWDAAESMNFGGFTSLWLWALPQSWKVILPPSLSFTVGLIKSTSIASQISVFELTYAAKVLDQKGFSALLTFGTVLILYFIICYPLNLLAGWLETKLGGKGGRALDRPLFEISGGR